MNSPQLSFKSFAGLTVSPVILLFAIIMLSITSAQANMPEKIRIASFNVSMEALNYRNNNTDKKVTGNELTLALGNNNKQIKNIAEIIQRVNPDIILLNEFDRVDNSNINYFITHYLNKGQQGQESINYPYFYQGKVNTGVVVNGDANNDGKSAQRPSDTHGFGYFEGHFGMVLLSKYPIDDQAIRTFQHFKWHKMPNALKPIDPETNQPWYSEEVWQALRLSSKSHWDIPVVINGKRVHFLASHPTPPVFDGPEDRNGKRNHDEVRFWLDYISTDQGQYIYDDKQNYGGLGTNRAFVILGDLNASNVEGDALTDSIDKLLTSAKISDPKPESIGGKSHNEENLHAKHHTAYWGMRADYVLPSTTGLTVLDSGVFWPEKSQETYRLIKNRQASSDHRLVWVDVKLAK